MSRVQIQAMNVQQLVEHFIYIAVEQSDAAIVNNSAKYNRFYSQMDEVRNELKKREGDQRRALISLFDHPNAQVRLKAAITTLVLAPESSKQVLKNISDRNEFPQAAEANGILWGLEDGSFKPS
jgi:hypothetical protein